MHGGGRRLLGIEPGGADDALDEIVVQERLHRPGLGPGPGDHDPVGRLPAVEREQLARDGLVVPLLLRADPVVVGVLAPARAALVAVEPPAAGAVGAEAGQLPGVVGRHLEEPGARPVQHHRQQPAELVLDRGELADERRRVHGQAGAVAPPAAAAPRTGRCASQAKSAMPWVTTADSPVSGDTAGSARDRGRSPPARRAVEAQPRQRLRHLAHAVLDLDEVLPAAPVARLQLEVAADHPVRARAHGGEPRQPLGHRRHRLPCPSAPVARLRAAGRAVASAVRRRSAPDNCHRSPRAHAGSRTACSTHARNRAWLE